VSAEGTQQTKVIPAGGTGGIVTVALDLDGNVEEYPGDRHTTSLWLSAIRQMKGLDPDPIPLRLQAYGAWPGLDIGTTASDPAADWARGWNGQRRMDIVVTRSHATTAVVYFSIVLTWMLFAMTAFRNALPGAPPMGAFSDYLAFFWGYAVAIVAVGVITTVWLWRRPPKDGPPAG